MGLTITLPEAGLLGITGVVIEELTTDTTLVNNRIYILQGADARTITLPADPNAGEVIVLKRIGSGVWTVASDLVEGVTQTIEITNNQSISLYYVNSTFGWLIT